MLAKRIKHITKQSAVLLIIVSTWLLVDYILNIQEILLPNPIEILTSLVQNINNLTKHALITIYEAMLGFLLAAITSIVLAITFTQTKKIKQLLYPYIVAIQAAPILAFTPLLILWFGNGYTSKIVIAALISFFPILTNMIKGLNSVKQEQIQLFQTFGATKNQILIKLRIPYSLPFLMPALKTSVTYALAAATIAEFTGSSKGIGSVIITASYYLDTSLLFAALLMISLIGILFFYSMDYIERRVVFWE